MGLVKFALKFRITFYVLAILILLSGVGASVVANKDVLPNVNIPVVVVVWTYTGLDPTEMASRVTTYSEFGLSNNVNGIRRMKSTTLQGVTISRFLRSRREHRPRDRAGRRLHQFDPRRHAAGNSASRHHAIRGLFGSRHSAGADVRSEYPPQIYDYAQYRIRQTLTQVPGSTLPSPYGGAPRQIMVDLDLNALASYGLTPLDVTSAITAQNLVVPSGLVKIGDAQYPIRLNASPEAVESSTKCRSRWSRQPGPDPGRRLGPRWIAAAAERRAVESPARRPRDGARRTERPRRCRSSIP